MNQELRRAVYRKQMLYSQYKHNLLHDMFDWS
jgi:hypothetical protein